MKFNKGFADKEPYPFRNTSVVQSLCFFRLETEIMQCMQLSSPPGQVGGIFSADASKNASISSMISMAC